MKKYPIDKLVQDISKEIKNNNPTKIVIDLRHNSGGNSHVIHPLIEYFKSKDIFISNKVYVCIGRNTYSSGSINALDFCRNKVILIGEPTGGSSISYGEVLYFELPNSKSRIHYTIKLFNLRDCENKQYKKGTNTIEPQIRIPIYSNDYLEGKDKVLEFIINDN